MVGLYAKMLRLKAATVKTPDESIGPAVVATGTSGSGDYTPEVWGVHGVYSVPPDDTFGARLPLGGSERFAPVVATHHYATPRPTLAKGEVALMATSASGTAAGGKVVARADGTLEINGTAKRLVTWDELNTALQTFMTALNTHTHPTAATGPPSPPSAPMSLDITTSKTTTVKTGG